MRIARISFFDNDPNGDGGAKRAYQIKCLLENAGISETYFKVEDMFDIARLETTSSRKTALVRALRNLKLFRQTYCRLPANISMLEEFGTDLLISESVLEHIQGFDLVLNENTRPDYFIFNYLLNKKYEKVIYMPQNIESLVPYSELNTKKYKYDLDQELKLYRGKKVLTISRTDQWLLSLHGIEAEYLPYELSPKQQDELHRIAQKRKDSPKNYILVIGGVGNEPTYHGMKSLIEYFIENASNIPEIKVKFAGFYTERLQHMGVDCPNVEILGEVTQEELYELYEGAKFCIINQGYSTGLLMKIPELIAVGVPILADTGSARGFYGEKGIITFDHLDELISKINAIESGQLSSSTEGPESLLKKFLFD